MLMSAERVGLAVFVEVIFAQKFFREIPNTLTKFQYIKAKFISMAYKVFYVKITKIIFTYGKRESKNLVE